MTMGLARLTYFCQKVYCLDSQTVYLGVEMKGYKLSDQVRSVAKDKYVTPALRAGQTSFTIRVRNVLDDLAPLGFPSNNTPQVCNALRSEKFLKENGLEITSVDGPPSKLSTTVVVHYRKTEQGVATQEASSGATNVAEDAATRALRLTEKLKGLLREELKEYGGAEAFIRWIRSDDEEAA